MNGDHLYKFSIPPLTEGSTGNLKKIGPGVSGGGDVVLQRCGPTDGK